MSDIAGTVVKVGASVASKGALGALMGAVPWLPAALGIAALAATLAGAGTAVWYRMQWKDCQAAQAEAIDQQRILDRQDNMKAVSSLTGQLNANQRAYDKAMDTLASIPRSAVCTNDPRVRAARDILCAKYPTSEACSGSVPPPKVP